MESGKVPTAGQVKREGMVVVTTEAAVVGGDNIHGHMDSNSHRIESEQNTVEGGQKNS